MLKNYLKLTWRNLARNSTYSIIIISGLVLAYSACLVIFLFVKSETSYDRQSADAERIYRVVHNSIDDAGTVVPDATTSSAFAPFLLQDISQIESAVRITPTWGVKALVQAGDKSFYEPRLVGADSNMIGFFGLKVIAGDPILKDRKQIAITETIAKKYFGDEDPLGKTMQVLDSLYSVSTVIADFPPNMHFHFDIISYLWMPDDMEERWGAYNYFTYIKLKEGADIADVNPQIQQAFEKYRPNRKDQFYTQQIMDVHLKSKTKWELEANGDQVFVTVFITIGVFIFLIASVNYINLSIVQALNRSKEVGVRKVSGAESRELVDQFLLESTLISFLSFVVAVIIVQGVTPLINVVFNQHIGSLFDLPFYYLAILLLCAIGAGVASGLYPALYLSAFEPAKVLKGAFQPGSRNLWVRKSLVVLQFAISIALITGATMVFMQVDYLRSKELGFSTGQVIIVPNVYEFKNMRRLKEAFLNVNGVETVSASNGTFGGQNSVTSLAAKGIGLRTKVDFTHVDEDYPQTAGLDLIAGRTFTHSDVASVPAKVILNETAVNDLGLDQENAVGTLVTMNPYADSVIYYEVVGVAKDFHFASLRKAITPYAFVLSQKYFSNFTVKVSTSDYDQLLSDLQKAWTSAGSPGPFEYYFLDQQFANLYRTEENFKLIFTILTIISIYIACSGLFAVSSYFIKRRTKEIGIRKALGASVSQVTWLVSSGFLRMVLIANLLAWPATWLFMNEWLNGFAYRIDMNWVIFLISGVLALVIAVGTIGGQSVRAAQANPIQSLRNE